MMIHNIHPVIEYLRHHPHYGELFTFIVSFTESLPLIGTLIPGTITMTLVGILIGNSVIPITLTLLVASVAAFFSDCIGFLIGHYYNERLRNIWPFRSHPAWLTISESFFRQHGGKSIIIGRFVGPVRSTVPLIAGLLKLSFVRFTIAAVPSAILWSIVYTFPGIMLGILSREIPHGETTRFLLCGIGIIAALSLVFWIIQYFFFEFIRYINILTEKLWNYFIRKKQYEKFIRLIANQKNSSDYYQLTLFLCLIVCVLLFLILLFNVKNHSILTSINLPIFHLLQSIRTPFFDRFFVIITIMNAPKTMMIITALLVIGLFIYQKRKIALHLLIVLLLTVIGASFFKFISHSPRPTGFVIVDHSSSFPSGHSLFAVTITLFLTFLLSEIFQKKSRSVFYAVAITWILLAMVSRLYLGAHWLTDVIGSLFFGISVLLVCIISYRRTPNNSFSMRLSLPQLLVLLCVGFFVPWGILIATTFQNTIKRYTPSYSTQTINIQDWWRSPLKYTPLYRNNRLGKPFQPFNVQYQGSLEILKNILTKKGWQNVSHNHQMKTELERFTSYNPKYHTPLLPWLYHNKPPVLSMMKLIPHHHMMIELRLWNSDVYFDDQHHPLWIGATDIRISPQKLLSLKHATTISLAKSGGMNQLQRDTIKFQQKIIQIQPIKQTPKKIQVLQWNKKILLIKGSNKIIV